MDASKLGWESESKRGLSSHCSVFREKHKADTPFLRKRLWLRTGTPTDMLPVTRKRKVRSKFRWLTGFCNSHYVSHFAAFFIVVGAKTSVAESVCVCIIVCVWLCFKPHNTVWFSFGLYWLGFVWKPETGLKKWKCFVHTIHKASRVVVEWTTKNSFAGRERNEWGA